MPCYTPSNEEALSYSLSEEMRKRLFVESLLCSLIKDLESQGASVCGPVAEWWEEHKLRDKRKAGFN